MRRICILVQDQSKLVIPTEVRLLAQVGEESFVQFENVALAALHHDRIVKDGKEHRLNYRSLYTSALEAITCPQD